MTLAGVIGVVGAAEVVSDIDRRPYETMINA
jgi:hypothetical protein